jgi:predicted transcriptional regulator of viral defense system
MRKEDFAKELERNGLPVFTIGDAKKILGKTGPYISKYLSDNQYIFRLERGKYALKSVTDINVLASHIIQPSYVSLISALRFYNLTTQLPRVIYVISTKRHKEIRGLLGYDLKFRTVGKNLLFGYTNVHGANIARIEKAFLDSLYFNKDIYSINEEFKTAIDQHRLNVDLLKEYALLAENRNLINVLGFFLEKNGLDAKELTGRISRNYVKLTPSAKKRNRRWRVMF